ncbi:3-dehydroquinate synthase [Perilla frutescens var. frutescens]|nr:3-dehydroquinate synthase [Perilla frutescens var. frutescens]
MSKVPVFFCFFVLAFGIFANASKNHGLGIYEIKRGDFSLKVTNYGARISSIVVPDKNGKLADIVLGYDTAQEYKNDTGHFGAIVGRVANRIAGAKFTLNGTVYKLDANEGKNMLHGGKKGFSQVVWKVSKHQKYGKYPYITLTYHSVDGEEGFPGDVLASVTYALLEPYKLSVIMKAKVLKKATPVNLAQHSYWNLGGHNSGNILSDELQIFASHITPVDSQLIPTGKLASVKKTPYDFLAPHVIKGPIKELPNGSKGFDINYAVDGGTNGLKMKPVAVVYNKKSGRVMKLWANAPGVQLYTGNFINNVKGKGGFIYQSHAALCLETQGFPDSVNHPNFPSQIVNPGQIYDHRAFPLLISIEDSLMAALLPSASPLQLEVKGKFGSCGIAHFSRNNKKRTPLLQKPCTVKAMSAHSVSKSQKKQVWIWTKKKEVLTAAVERGWNTLIFHSDSRELAAHWTPLALFHPLFVEEGGLFDGDHVKVATFFEVSSPAQLENLQPLSDQAENIVVDLLDWQVIPAENIVAAIQGTQKTVFAVSKTPSEAQLFLEALEHGLGGVVLKTEDPNAIIEMKEYLDRRNNEGSLLELTKATVVNIQMVGMGDRVCVDLCSLMKPGEGLLAGSFARGLFLVHSECLESNYISSRPFRVNAGPVHAYVAVPGGKTSYLSELKVGKEVVVVDQNGIQRTAIVGRVKIETRPLILIEAKVDHDKHTTYSIILQNAETVALVPVPGGHENRASIPVSSLQLGDEILLRVQGGARHTGIEIEEFIVEK